MTKALPVPGLRPKNSLDENARKILKIRLAEFYALATVVDQELAVAELHNLRIAAKRLRYSLELFPTVFGEAGARNIDRIKALQEELGVIHDIDVRIELIRSELLAQNETQLDSIIEELMTASKTAHRAILTSALRPPPDDPRRGLYALLGRQMLDRRERYRAFITLWNEFEGAGMRSDLVQMTWDSSRACASKDPA